MATYIVPGPTSWEGGRDEDGHRTWKYHCQTIGTLLDGPAAHIQTPGLPVPGSIWAVGNDLDVYAWCTGAAELRPREQKGNILFDHVYTFTTKPRGQAHGKGNKKDDRGSRKKCADVTIQDPLSEPPKTSGGRVRNTEEFAYDKDGLRIIATSFEPFTGPMVEFDRSRGQVTVELNDVNLNLDVIEPAVDTVSAATLWGLPARCWKLSEFHWDRKLYGSCFFYYTKRFVFESNVGKSPSPDGLIVVDRFSGNSRNIAPGSTYSKWDHYVPDVSSLALHGHWDLTGAAAGNGASWVVDAFADGTVPDKNKPNHYIAIGDPRKGGTNIRRCLSRNIRGTPAKDPSDELVWAVQVYPETDFLAAIPRLPVIL